jgi:hypothetical protein
MSAKCDRPYAPSFRAGMRRVGALVLLASGLAFTLSRPGRGPFEKVPVIVVDPAGLEDE